MAVFKSKYKKLVDQIYLKPQKTDADITPVALDSNRINTLTYYSSNYPEKVAKISNYFHKKIVKQVKRRSYEYVDVSLQALDILLASSSNNAYNLYAEHFLAVAATMLETDDYQIQQLATRSLVKFAEIKEETTFYPGCYEPLIIKYSAMCEESDSEKRILGATGLYAIVRKISFEELAENMWQPIHLDKMISGLLCCMTQFKESLSRESIIMETCGLEAEKCMSLLMSTASFGQVASVLNSVYNYIDESNLWGKRLFVDHIYHLIMNSIQSRYWSAIVINGISRLQQQVSAPIPTRRNQLKVFCTILGLMKNQALGSLTFDYLNFLFTEIPRINIDGKAANSQEIAYTQDLMDCLESVSMCLAEYETLEVMVFIVNKIIESKTDSPVKDVMFRCLYTVTLNYNNRFPAAMYKPLMQLMQEPATAVMGQAVFHRLLDLNGNLATINEPAYDLKLRTRPFCRPNEHFVKNHDLEIYRVLLKILSFDSVTSSHISAVFKSMTVMATYQDPNIVVRFLACLLLMQEVAVSERLIPENRVKLLIGTLALLVAASEITATPGLTQYGKELIVHRGNHAKWQSNAKVLTSGEKVSVCCLIDERILCERMVDRSDEEFVKTGILKEMSAIKELLISRAPIKDRETTSSGVIIETKSWSSARLFEDRSVVPIEGNPLGEDLSFEAMKAVLAEPIEETRRRMTQKQAELKQKYQNCTHRDIMNDLYNEDEDRLREMAKEIINSETKLDPAQKPISEVLEERFPDIFY